MHLLLPILLAGCLPDNAFGTRDDADGPDDGASLTCGVNAQPRDGRCVCVESYDWCDAAGGDCCALDATAFRVTVREVVVAPYNSDWYDEPWDWDGDVPDWLIDALELVGEYYPEAATAAEVAELVDEYAPEILEGTVPPDPFFEVYDAEATDTLYASDTVDDAYEAPFRETFRLSAREADGAILYFYDEDLSFDDDVDGFALTFDDLAWAAGQGPIESIQNGDVFSLTVEVEAEF